jgi:hypothetical protein
MGILSMITADLQDLTLFSSNTGFTLSTTQKRTGTHSFRGAYGNQCTLSTPSIVEGYLRFAILDASAASGSYSVTLFNNDIYAPLLTFSRSAGTIVFGVEAGNAGMMGSSTASGVPFNPVDTWDVIEIHWKISDTVGILQVKVNGTQYMDFSGDTWLYGSLDVGAVKIVVVQATTYVYIDDIIVRDDIWPGRGGLYVLTPNAGSATEGWTASTGDPETCVDELPASSGDYIYTDATVDGTEHLVGLTALPTASWNVRGVGVFAQALATQDTDAFARTLLVSDGNQQVGSGIGITSGPAWLKSYYATEHDAAPWTDSSIAALEIGVESVVPS